MFNKSPQFVISVAMPLVTLFILIAFVSLSYSEDIGGAGCTFRCTGGTRTIVGTGNLVFVGFNENYEPIFKDTTEYFCERVTYCTDYCKDPSMLCAQPEDLNSVFTKTATKQGYWTTYDVSVSTTFKCNDGSSYGPYKFSKQMKIKDCTEYQKAWHDAEAKKGEACKDITDPESLLTTESDTNNGEEIGTDETSGVYDGVDCTTFKARYDDDQLDLAQTQDTLANAKSKLDLLKMQLANMQSDLTSLQEDYSFLQADLDEKSKILHEREMKLLELDFELRQIWLVAIGEMGGPLIGGASTLIGFIVSVAEGGKNSAPEAGKLAVEFHALPMEAGGLEWAGPAGTVTNVVINGVSLQQLANEVREAEAARDQALDWYSAAVSAMNSFVSRGDYSVMISLPGDILDKQREISSKESEISSLEAQISSLKNDAQNAMLEYTACMEAEKAKAENDAENAAEAAARAVKAAKDAACKTALIKEKDAKKAYDDCEAAQ